MPTSEPPTSDLGVTIRTVAAEQQLFSRYTLRKVLGRGGMGIVWLAHDDELKRNVAMKFLPDMIVRDREAVEDLKRETRRSLDLTHHHIVRIYDFTQDDSCAAIVMEYVDGDSLSALKTHQPGGCFSVSTIQNWVGHFCQAMDYAHRQARVVHRDLKPANLMVNGRGDLKVTDFGISRSMSDSMTRVSMSNSAGTLAYMSPEQALGSPPAVGDDVYAFGATVYDLLSGRPPFFRGNLQVQLETVTPPPIEQRRTELGNTGEPIPALWEEVIAACLAKRLADRPQSMMEIANLLGVAGGSTAGTSHRFAGAAGGGLGVPGTSPTAHAPATTPTQQPTVHPDDMPTRESVPHAPSSISGQPTQTGQQPMSATRQEDVFVNVAPHIAARRPTQPASASTPIQPPTSATNRTVAPEPEPAPEPSPAPAASEYTPPVVTHPPQHASADEVIEPPTMRGVEYPGVSSEPEVTSEPEAWSGQIEEESAPAEPSVADSSFDAGPSAQEAAPMQSEAEWESAAVLPSESQSYALEEAAPIAPFERSAQPVFPPKRSNTGLILAGLGALVLVAGAGIFFGWRSDSSGTREPAGSGTGVTVETAPSAADEWVDQARALIEDENPADAKAALDQALALDPAQPEVPALMAQVDQLLAKEKLAEERAAQKEELLTKVDAALAASDVPAARKLMEAVPAFLADDPDLLRKKIEITKTESDLALLEAKKNAADEVERQKAAADEKALQERLAAKARAEKEERTQEANRVAAANAAKREKAKSSTPPKRTAARTAAPRRDPEPVRRAQPPPPRPQPAPARTTQKPFRRTPFGGGAPGG